MDKKGCTKMIQQQRRQFTPEFKRQIVQELETKSLSEVCRTHNIHPSTVSGWRNDHERDPKGAFKGHGRLWKPEAKIAQYERLVGKLTLELELLKKTYESLKERQAEERRSRR